MKKNIEITIKKDKGGELYNTVKMFELSESNNVKSLIDLIKDDVSQLKGCEIVKEELFYGTQLMKLEETVPCKNGIELEVTIK